MTSREFWLERRRVENPIFLQLMKSLPADQIDYKPHERSPSAKQIVWTMTNELTSCLDVVTKNRGEWSGQQAPPFDEMLVLFEQRLNDLTSEVEKMDEASWTRVAKFYVGDKVVSEQPVGQWLWYILFDAIHHRGQLSTYLRPMGGKVPAIYGPSGDSRKAN
jgi:uncharacterized damage-inducible protein DinB